MDELQLLLDHRPATTDPAPRAVEIARARLIDLVDAEPAAPIGSERHGLSTRRRSRRTALGVAVTVAAAVLVGVVVGFGHGTNPVQTNAATALGSLARTAQARPLPGHGDVVHTKVEADYGGGPQVTEKWIGPDGSQRIIVTGGGAGTADGDFRRGPTDRGYPDWHGWPANPDGVLERLRSEAAKTDMRPVDFEAFQGAADALRASAAPTPIRAAFFEAVAKLDGVEALGTVADHGGRTGLGFQMHSDASHHTELELIFDPATAELMAENSRETNGANPTWADYVVAEFVDRIPPGGTLLPPDPCAPRGC